MGQACDESSCLVGVYIPCGSAWTMWSCLCSEKTKVAPLSDNFPQSPQQHQQRCVPTLSAPTTMNTTWAAQMTHWHHLGMVCFFYQSIITYTNCFSFFLLGSILLLMMHEQHQQE